MARILPYILTLSICTVVLWPGQIFANMQPPKEVVVTTLVEKGKIQRVLEFVGSFFSINSVVLKSEIQGIIEQIHFKDGGSVKKGETLFTLHNAEQKAKVKKAEAALALSKNTLKRKAQLEKQDFLSKDELDKAQAQVKSDEAELDLAQDAYNKTIIKAPFDCVLSSRKVSVGAYVSPGDELVTCSELNPLKFDFQAAENQMNLLAKGQKVTVTTDAVPGVKFSGKIDSIEPVIDEKTKSTTVHADFPNQDGKLRPGFFGHSSVETNETHEAIVIPEEALVIRQDGNYVFKVAAGPKAELTKVTLGMRADDKAEVLTGLNVGDEIVLKGQEKIKDGSEITIVKNK